MRFFHPSFAWIAVYLVLSGELAGAAFTNYQLYKFRELVQDSTDPPAVFLANFGIRAIAWYTPEEAEAEASLTLTDRSTSSPSAR
jgi:hypothetical protein